MKSGDKSPSPRDQTGIFSPGRGVTGGVSGELPGGEFCHGSPLTHSIPVSPRGCSGGFPRVVPRRTRRIAPLNEWTALDPRRSMRQRPRRVGFRRESSLLRGFAWIQGPRGLPLGPAQAVHRMVRGSAWACGGLGSKAFNRGGNLWRATPGSQKCRSRSLDPSPLLRGQAIACPRVVHSLLSACDQRGPGWPPQVSLPSLGKTL